MKNYQNMLTQLCASRTERVHKGLQEQVRTRESYYFTTKDLNAQCRADELGEARFIFWGGRWALTSGTQFVTHIFLVILKLTNPSLNCADTNFFDSINVANVEWFKFFCVEEFTDTFLLMTPVHGGWLLS